MVILNPTLLLATVSTFIGVVWLSRYSGLVRSLEVRPSIDWTATLDDEGSFAADGERKRAIV